MAAQEIAFQGVTVKKRGPWMVWFLTLITASIYGFVWWYKVNKELRAYSEAAGAPLNNNPTNSLLAFIPGALIIVPPYVSIWRGCERVATLKASVGAPADGTPSGVLAIIGQLVLGLHPVVIQPALNQIWDTAVEKAGQGGLPALAGPGGA